MAVFKGWLSDGRLKPLYCMGAKLKGLEAMNFGRLMDLEIVGYPVAVGNNFEVGGL